MKVLFMGTTPFSCVILQSLLEENYNVIGAVTQPDRPFGRKKELKMPQVKELALKHNIPVFQPENIKQAIDEINNLDADLIVTCAYGQIVPMAIIRHPRLEAVNIHASLLPKYRGGAPIHWAIIKGESETGLTLMKMAARMDSGDMIASRKVKIDFDDTFSDVEAKLMEISKDIIRYDLKEYIEHPDRTIKQDESEVSFAYAITKEDEHINFKQSTLNVYNHIRGLIEWPVAYALLDDKRIKFHGVKWTDKKSSKEPGSIVEVDENGLYIATIDGCVQITEIQDFGKKKQSIADFYNGYHKSWEGKVFQ